MPRLSYVKTDARRTTRRNFSFLARRARRKAGVRIQRFRVEYEYPREKNAKKYRKPSSCQWKDSAPSRAVATELRYCAHSSPIHASRQPFGAWNSVAQPVVRRRLARSCISAKTTRFPAESPKFPAVCAITSLKSDAGDHAVDFIIKRIGPYANRRPWMQLSAERHSSPVQRAVGMERTQTRGD